MVGVLGGSEVLSDSSFCESDSVVNVIRALLRKVFCVNSSSACSERRFESSFAWPNSACVLFSSDFLACSRANASRMNSCPGSRAAEEILDYG